MTDLFKKEAIDLLNKHGLEDGQKHITQMIYFSEGGDNNRSLAYWIMVDKEYKNATNNNTPNKEI